MGKNREQKDLETSITSLNKMAKNADSFGEARSAQLARDKADRQLDELKLLNMLDD